MPSDPGTARRWLADIHHHIILAQTFAAGMNYDALRDDQCVTYAVTRCLGIISETSRRLPDALKARHPSIPWRDMAAAGNIYRHEYEDVAVRGVWDTLSYHLAPLRIVIEQEMATGDP